MRKLLRLNDRKRPHIRTRLRSFNAGLCYYPNADLNFPLELTALFYNLPLEHIPLPTLQLVSQGHIVRDHDGGCLRALDKI